MLLEDTELKVYFATNRSVSDDGFTNQISDISVGEATVEIRKRSRQAGEKVNDTDRFSSHVLATDGDSNTPLTGKDGIEYIFENLTRDVRKKRKSTSVHTSVLVYIHGFRNSFEHPIKRGARLANIYSSDGHQFVPFVLSWPSYFELSPEGFSSAQENAEKTGGSCGKNL